MSAEQKNGISPELLAARREYYKSCMEQNQEHARHIENERLNFTSIFMAIICGALAFAFDGEPGVMQIILLAVLILLEVIAIYLVHRWDVAYDRRRKAVNECEELWRDTLADGKDRMKTMIPSSGLGKGIRTRNLILAIYVITLLAMVAMLVYCLWTVDLSALLQ